MKRLALVAVALVVSPSIADASAGALNPLPRPLSANVGSVDGQVYLLGGYDNSNDLTVQDPTTYRYDAASDSWVDIGMPLPNIAGRGSAVVSTRGHIWVIGPSLAHGQWIEQFTPGSGWVSTDMSGQRAYPPAAADSDGHIWFFTEYAAGSRRAAVWEFLPERDQWIRRTSKIPHGLQPQAATSAGTSIYVAGLHRMYRVRNGKLLAANLPMSTWGYGFKRSADGRIWMLGGFDDDDHEIHDVWAYSPQTNHWHRQLEQSITGEAVRGIARLGTGFILAGGLGNCCPNYTSANVERYP